MDSAQRLFEEHGAAVYRFALVLVRHHQDAEDVVQETFMKVLQHLQASGDTTNIRGWLFTVAANAARDRQRRRMRWLPWTPANDAIVGPAPLRDEDGRIRALKESIRHLTDRDRLLLALRAQGLSYREIASAAGVNPTSVGQFLARAVERWSQAMETERGERHDMSYERAGSGRR
jgi:RNA polymerase sigma-70 factor, ECF subfamily